MIDRELANEYVQRDPTTITEDEYEKLKEIVTEVSRLRESLTKATSEINEARRMNDNFLHPKHGHRLSNAKEGVDKARRDVRDLHENLKYTLERADEELHGNNE